MTVILNCIKSRIFCVWRWVHIVIMIAWTILFFRVNNVDIIGTQIAYPNFFLGVVPAAIFLFLRYTKLNWACWFAFAYDLLIILTLLVGLVFLPNYYGLFFFFPLAGFICEFIILIAILIASKPHR